MTSDEALLALLAVRPGLAALPPLFVAAGGAHAQLGTLLETPFEVDLQAWARAPEAHADFAAIARALIEGGADVNERRGVAGFTPLLIASYAGRKDVVETLLELGANADVLDLWGRSAGRLRNFARVRRLLRLFERVPTIRCAYFSEIHLPVSHQFTTPYVLLELDGALPPDLFSNWPGDDPLTIGVLGDDPVSRLMRLGAPIYLAPKLETTHELGSLLAAALGGKLQVVRAGEHEGDPVFVSSGSGAVPFMIRLHYAQFEVALPGGPSFHPACGRPSHEAVAELLAAAEAWEKEPHPHVSMWQVALELRAALERECGLDFAIKLPGTPVPKELWLGSRDGGSAAVGIFPDGARAWLEGRSEALVAKTPAALPGLAERIVGRVRDQMGHYQRNLALAGRIDAMTAELLAAFQALEPALAPDSEVASYTLGSTSYEGAHGAKLDLRYASGSRRELAELTSHQGAILLHAGVPGVEGFNATLGVEGIAAETLAGAIAAIRLALSVLTVAAMRSGARYRVLADLGGLIAGEVVVYGGFDDIDNHYGEYAFEGGDGRAVTLGGDCSNKVSDPLGQVHRHLEEVVEGS